MLYRLPLKLWPSAFLMQLTDTRILVIVFSVLQLVLFHLWLWSFTGILVPSWLWETGKDDDLIICPLLSRAFFPRKSVLLRTWTNLDGWEGGDRNYFSIFYVKHDFEKKKVQKAKCRFNGQCWNECPVCFANSNIKILANTVPPWELKRKICF